MMWTCLLHALGVHTELMCEHHLDQMIMCSVYCICKLNTSITFAEIVKEYRFQPQAVNSVSDLTPESLAFFVILTRFCSFASGLPKRSRRHSGASLRGDRGEEQEQLWRPDSVLQQVLH